MAEGGLQVIQALKPDRLVRILPPPLSTCVTLGELLNLYELHFLILKVEMSLGWCGSVD